MNKKLFIIILIVIAISMIVTCEPPMPKTDYRIVTIKNTDLSSIETPKPYNLTTNTYNEGDHLYWRTSVTMDDDGTTTEQSIEQTLNENKFPTKQVITNYNEGTPEETKQFIDFVYDETLFLPTSVIKYEGVNDTSKEKTEENTYTYDDKGILLSMTTKYYSEGEVLEEEITMKNFIPQNTKKIHEQMLVNMMGPEAMQMIFMGVFVPSLLKEYNAGVLSNESVINFDGDGYPTTMVQTDHTETPPVVTTIYFKVTLDGGKISSIGLFDDAAYTTPVSGNAPSKIEYTYNDKNIISQIDVYFYVDSTETLAQKMVYDWIDFPVITRNGSMPAFTISYFNGTSFEEVMKMAGEWTTDLILVMTRSVQGRFKALIPVDEITITFEVVDVE